jgi:hypothetical protein
MMADIFTIIFYPSSEPCLFDEAAEALRQMAENGVNDETCYK